MSFLPGIWLVKRHSRFLKGNTQLARDWNYLAAPPHTPVLGGLRAAFLTYSLANFSKPGCVVPARHVEIRGHVTPNAKHLTVTN